MPQRRLIGLIAAGLLVTSGLLLWSEAESAAHVQARAACLRIGVTMGAVWLAYPRLQRLPAWLLGGVLMLAVVVAVRPRLLPLAAVLLVVMLIVRPRGGGGRSR